MSASLPNYFSMNTTREVGNSSSPENTNRNNNYSLSSSPPEKILSSSSSAHPIAHVHSRADGLTSSTSASSSNASISPIYPPMSATPSSTDSRSFIADHNKNNNNCTSNPTISPQPKKSWERHYKSFLNKVGQNSHNKDDHGNNNNGNRNILRNGNNGFDVLIPPRLESIKSADFTHVMRKTSQQQSPVELNRQPIYSSNHRQPTHPSSYSNAHSNNSHDNSHSVTQSMSRLSVKSTDKVHSTSELNASTSDTAVRGGSLFKSVFHKKKNKHSETLKLHNKHQSLSKNTRRKTKSYDSLDTSQRLGLNVGQTQLRASHIDATIRRMPSTGPSSLDDSVRGGSLRGGRSSSLTHPSPSLAASMQDGTHMAGGIRTPSRMSYRNHRNGLINHQTPPTTSTEIKKVFTEFHNSKEFGKDTSSPYLGDETSVHQNQIFDSLFLLFLTVYFYYQFQL